MDREILEVGDTLTQIVAPGPIAHRVGKGVKSISVDRLPGPMGFYIVAHIKFEDGGEELVPLHFCESVEIGHR